MARKLPVLLLPLLLAMTTSTTFAADDDEVKPDARLEGYVRGGNQTNPMPLFINPIAGTSATWVLFIIMSIACIMAMCKSGKRTHLD